MPGGHSPFPENTILGKLSIAVVGLFVTALLLFTLYKMAATRCFRLPLLSRDDQAEETLRLSESGGLSADALGSLPVVQYRESDGGRSDCVICLDGFGDGEQIRTLPYCSHSFHVRCVDTWFRSHSDCPLCRKEVLDVANEPKSPVLFSNGSSLEALPREDVSRERSMDYRVFLSQDARYQMFRGDARGIQSPVWL